MTHHTLAARPHRRTVLVAAASLATALTTLAGVGGATAAVPPDPDLACVPYDADSTLDGAALAGMTVSGLTVSQGTTPDAFSGTVLGVLEDGLQPGVDLILARLSSPEINRVGIWNGMSGSPVYADDGKLLGAVAYGLALGPSTVAGITPAAAMQDVADGASPAASSDRIALPASLQRTVVARSRVSARAADSGLSALRTPVGVSGGATDKRLKKIKRELGLTRVRMYRAAPAPAERGDASAIRAGGNLAVSLTYGDFSITGTGTVTAVCGDSVIGFGHPFTFTGPTTLTMQSASAIYVQEDPTLSGMKVSNATGPVGTITQDRFAGVAGTLGPVPDVTPITTTATVDEDGDGTPETTRTATSYTSVQEWVPSVTFAQALTTQDQAYDRGFAAGSGTGRFTITGTSTEEGPFSLTRENRYASRFDLSFEMGIEAPITLDRLWNNKFTDLTFDSVTVDSEMNPEPRLFRFGKVEQKVAGEWTRLGKSELLTAKPGKTLKFRVGLTSFRDRYGSKTVRVDVEIPERIKGRAFGFLVLGGGSQIGSSSRGADSLAEVVTRTETAPRNDELVASLFVEPRRSARIRRETATPVGDVVNGERFYELFISKRLG